MNPYERYREQMVTTMTQEDMLLKLYDEAIKRMRMAREAIQNSDIPAMSAAIDKAQAIFRYLKSTLDFKIPVASNLNKLYAFFDQQLMMASIKKDETVLDEIEPLVQELRDTFSQCGKLSRAGRPVTFSQARDVV